MGLYNVINRALMQTGQAEDISQVVANLDAIAAVLNGGIDNSNVNAGAAIDYSKINVPGSAILDTKVAGIVVVGAAINAGAANTDVAWDGGSAAAEYRNITTGGGSIRSIAIPTRGAGTRLVLRNNSAGAVNLLHATAGGTGAQLTIRGAASSSMAVGDIYELVYDGTTWVEIDRDVPVTTSIELDYVAGTANVNTTATTAATATAIITGNAVTYDGVTPVVIEFHAVRMFNSVANVDTNLNLYDGATDLGRIAKSVGISGQAGDATIVGARRLIPTAGSHTYSVKGWVSVASTGTVVGGAGGVGVDTPMFIRVHK